MGRRGELRRMISAGYAVLAIVLSVLAGGCGVVLGPTPTPTTSNDAKTAIAYFQVSPTSRPTATPTAAGTPILPTVAGRTPTPGRNSFVATEQEPCRKARYTRALPEQKSTVEHVRQVYRCLLLNYVGRATVDHTQMLNAGLAMLVPASKGKLTADDVAPLAWTGDRNADWALFAARFTQLAQKLNGQPDTSTLARAAMTGIAYGMSDNHVAYLEPKFWRRELYSELGLESFPSAGFELALDEETGKFYLYWVYPNSPADRAGLKRGDFVDKVGGVTSGRGQNNRPLYDLLAGLPGTGDTVQVTRPATGETKTILLQVGDVNARLIETKIYPGNIGYVRLRYFSFNADEAFEAALKQLGPTWLNGIIFDVRQNPGGSIAALQQILSHFTHQGPLSIMIDENGKREPLNPYPDVPLLNIPWVVLADGRSASSADITAGVAKDRGGHLVGTRSAGALGAALFFELEDGSALEITVLRVLGPDGEEINEVGVEPHHVVTLSPLDLSLGNDPPLQHALADLANAKPYPKPTPTKVR